MKTSENNMAYKHIYKQQDKDETSAFCSLSTNIQLQVSHRIRIVELFKCKT